MAWGGQADVHYMDDLIGRLVPLLVVCMLVRSRLTHSLVLLFYCLSHLLFLARS